LYFRDQLQLIVTVKSIVKCTTKIQLSIQRVT